MHAMKKNVITNRVCLLLEILLVEDRAVIAFFANPKNHITTKAIEAVTYGAKN
jgi:ABC-type methionine transport system ATPase subunit